MQPSDTFYDWTSRSTSIVFFGGAGVSTESGIPDFRSEDGLYRQNYRFSPETILSHDFFKTHTDEFYRFYREKMLCLAAHPNAAHRRLAQWEAEGRLRAIVTQNIDGLHQKAGSRRVWELHGSIHRNICLQCHAVYGVSVIAGDEGIPRCAACGGLIKPDVVLYGESLDEAVLRGAVSAIEEAEVLIVAGTSLTVYPAAGLIRYYRGNKMILINRTPTPYDSQADLVIRQNVGKIFESWGSRRQNGGGI